MVCFFLFMWLLYRSSKDSTIIRTMPELQMLESLQRQKKKKKWTEKAIKREREGMREGQINEGSQEMRGKKRETVGG